MLCPYATIPWTRSTCALHGAACCETVLQAAAVKLHDLQHKYNSNLLLQGLCLWRLHSLMP